MGEFILLAKVGMVIDVVVKIGYGIAGSYFVKTGIRYIQDYKESVAREKEGVQYGTSITYGNTSK